MEETNCNGSKRKGEAQQDQEESGAKRQNVTMAMDIFDCPVCSQPLRPPIFQCSVGHFIRSSCRDKLLEPERKCNVCSGAVSQRCDDMERVVDNILVPCKHGSAKNMITYYRKEEHERGCPKGPCFCPVSGCGFTRPKALLLVHLTTHHRWPMTRFEYSVPFELCVQPGTHTLHAGDGCLSFLLDVASTESLGHAVSLVCVQPNAPGPTIGCSVCFSCFQSHYQVSSLDVGSSSLSDGLPTQPLCVVPKVSGGETDVVLRISIDMVYANDDEELEEDDDDNSYNEEEDDDDDEEEEEEEEEEEADNHNGG